MGNKSSALASENETPVNLAMMAVARNVQVDKTQIMALRNAMAANADDNGKVSREGFDRALELSNLSGMEIFDLLFTMWDNVGEDSVPLKTFCTGISPLSCPYDELSVVIRFALRVCDDTNRGIIDGHDVQNVLYGKSYQSTNAMKYYY
jgi:Ca2+-binding EF-hand superfamily protein